MSSGLSSTYKMENLPTKLEWMGMSYHECLSVVKRVGWVRATAGHKGHTSGAVHQIFKHPLFSHIATLPDHHNKDRQPKGTASNTYDNFFPARLQRRELSEQEKEISTKVFKQRLSTTTTIPKADTVKTISSSHSRSQQKAAHKSLWRSISNTDNQSPPTHRKKPKQQTGPFSSLALSVPRDSAFSPSQATASSAADFFDPSFQRLEYLEKKTRPLKKRLKKQSTSQEAVELKKEGEKPSTILKRRAIEQHRESKRWCYTCRKWAKLMKPRIERFIDYLIDTWLPG